MGALEWELQWIDAHLDRYDSVLHAQAVKGNIEKRYRINQLERDFAAVDEAYHAAQDTLREEHGL